MPASNPSTSTARQCVAALLHAVLPVLLAFPLPTSCADDSSSSSNIDFARDIRPIISENCSFCHGPDEATREADLRLDTAEGAWEVIEKHESEESELLRRLVTDDRDELMPPPESNRQLSKQEIDLIRRWIDEGAAWETHWSFRPIELRPARSALTISDNSRQLNCRRRSIEVTILVTTTIRVTNTL